MKKLILALCVFFVSSCGEKQIDGFNLDVSSPEATIKSSYEFTYSQKLYPVVEASEAYKKEHLSEILKTLEVVEKINIPAIEVTAIFYRYSIGSQVIRKCQYMKKIGNKWYFYSKYFSPYDDDPYKNGNGPAGKLLIKKIDDWEKESANIWWN